VRQVRIRGFQFIREYRSRIVPRHKRSLHIQTRNPDL
jgi:hypothetical protein